MQMSRKIVVANTWKRVIESDFRLERLDGKLYFLGKKILDLPQRRYEAPFTKGWAAYFTACYYTDGIDLPEVFTTQKELDKWKSKIGVNV